MSKPKFGDVFEIPTAKGLAYAQYTHQHPQFGGLIRVFDRLFSKRPESFDRLVHEPVRFSTFFPVRAAIMRGSFKIVGHAEIASQNKVFPVFRDGVPDPKTKKVATWWFWDGEKSWKVGEITPEQRKMPIRAIWTDAFLIERIESAWTPGTDKE
jgi:hypothetical protein